MSAPGTGRPAGGASVELVADCPACRTESAVLERYDPDHPACRFGVPADARCRLCGQRREGRVTRGGEAVRGDGSPSSTCPSCLAPLLPTALDEDRCACGAAAGLVTVEAGAIPADERALAARLGRWADDEGHEDVRTFLAATFAEPDLAAILGRLRAGEPVATLADPFALRAGGSLPGAAVPVEGRGPGSVVRGPETTREATTAKAAEPGRALLRPLLAVLAADGEVHPAERAIVDAFLAAEGLAPLADDECRVHRSEDTAHVVPPGRRVELLRLMCETALADGLPDGNELKVIYAFAAAWDVPQAQVEEWLWACERRHLPPARAMWLKVRRFVLVALWGVPAEEVDEHERATSEVRRV